MITLFKIFISMVLIGGILVAAYFLIIAFAMAIGVAGAIV